MSKKKNLTTLKDLSRTIGNKTPVQLVSSMVVKKKGKYHLTGSKEEKKIARAACQHHIIDKHGNFKPRFEYVDGNKKLRCKICGAIVPTSFFEDGSVRKRVDGLKEVVEQSKMIACGIGADRDTSMYLTSLDLQAEQLPKVYGKVRDSAEQADRKKKNKKNKKKQQNMGGWYQV